MSQLLFLRWTERSHLQPQCLQANEASRVALVVSIAAAAFHGRDPRIVQALGTFAPRHDDVALVEFQPHNAADVALRFHDEGLQRLPLGREPKAVVNELYFGITLSRKCITSRSMVSDSILPMRKVEERAARGFRKRRGSSFR
jgi:hypothetical protein